MFRYTRYYANQCGRGGGGGGGGGKTAPLYRASFGVQRLMV